MAAALDNTFALDLLLIFVVLFLLFSSANFIGMARDNGLARFIAKRGLTSGDKKAFGYWRIASILGIVVLALGATYFTLLTAMSAGGPPSLETVLFNLSGYVAAFLFFTSYRFFNRLVERLTSAPG